MVYGFVKQSGGYLTIESKPGLGASITLYFPRTRSDFALTEGPNVEKVDLRAQGERILVVEDKRIVRKMANALLIRLGYDVLEAENAWEALELLEREPEMHLLLTDILLSGHLNGFELAKEARRRWPKLKVLFMSGYAESSRPHHDDLGATPLVIEKPFTKEALALKVRQALAGF